MGGKEWLVRTHDEARDLMHESKRFGFRFHHEGTKGTKDHEEE